MNSPAADEQEHVLFLQETERIPAAIMNILRLLLHYRYGLEVLTESSIQEALPVSSQYGTRIRSMFVVRDQPVENRNSLLALGRRGQMPLFLLVPRAMVDLHKQLCKGLKNVYVCAWEDAIGGAGPSLQQVVIGLVTGNRGRLAPPVDYIEPLPPHVQRGVDGFLGCSFVGSPATVRAGLEAFIASTGADELIVASAIFDPAARLKSCELLAGACL